MYIRPKITIDLKAIKDNYLRFKEARSNPSTIMAAVVKDNAYGLGAEKVVEVLYKEAGCRDFFVAYAREGYLIRTFAPEANIYVLQGVGEEELEYYHMADLIPVIPSPKQLEFWNKHKPNDQKPAIQIETGLNRLGFSEEEILQLTKKERKEFCLVLSHLACADEPDHKLNKTQLENFKKRAEYFPNAKKSLSASDGFLLGKDFQFDVVRLGAVLYGINPIQKATPRSQNVINLEAPIIQIKKVKKGESIGYSSAYIAKRDMKIAIVSIGYGDGIIRSFSPKGKVWIKDNYKFIKIPVIGRISMDNLITDITNIDDKILAKNNYVQLITPSYTLDNFGKDAGTIGYEILSLIGHGIRTIRTYKS